jgi:hypothetical protein
MNGSRFISLAAVGLLTGSLFVGCGKKVAETHADEVPAGASFQAGKGVSLTDETRQILGLEVADVTEQKLPAQIRFNVQVFGEQHRPASRADDHSGCAVQGLGVLPLEKAAALCVGQAVQIQTQTKEAFAGIVLAVEKAISSDENEIIVGITNAATKLLPGEFLSAVVTLPREQAVTVIPRAALLRTVDGTFVYAVNGEAYFRTAVKVGAESAAQIEITDGLLTGDAVVTKPVETLWLIELRATKGSAGCCKP